MKLLIICLAFLLPFSATHTELHQFHVSKCMVEYNEAEQALQVSLHVFIDDFEEALRRQGKDELFICTKKEAPEASTYIAEYLAQHFRLSVDGKLLKYNFLGKEPSEDLAGMWCYLEITGVKKMATLGIENEILLEVFDDQKNLVNIIGPGRTQGAVLLQRGSSSEVIEFQATVMNRILKTIFILPIRFYQYAISPMLGPKCRYQPTCSHYMVGAIQEWGVLKGTWMGLKRIGRCHPWSKTHGYDPVPKNPEKKQITR